MNIVATFKGGVIILNIPYKYEQIANTNCPIFSKNNYKERKQSGSESSAEYYRIDTYLIPIK